jgi:YidC/Oxa1 family membrane protein insertase
MPTFGPLDAAAGVLYSLLIHVVDALRPVDGGAAVVIAIALFTAVVRLSLFPLSRRANSLLPALLQAPPFLVLHQVVSRAAVGGHANLLLTADLGGFALGASGLAAGWPLIAVLAGIAIVATISARRIRRTGQPAWFMLMPYLTLLPALFMPLAAGIYVLTTTALSAVLTRYSDGAGGAVDSPPVAGAIARDLRRSASSIPSRTASRITQ